jgi:SNF2 family DNA or RNA helicase
MALFDACVDLNPHQIDAAAFALRNPLSKGVLLADEVGLGKTIEAGLVMCQLSDKELDECVIIRNAFHGEWNYEIRPRTRKYR